MSVNIVNNDGTLKKIALGFPKEKFDVLQGDVSNHIETNEYASRDYAIDDLFIMANGQLVRAVNPIEEDTFIAFTDVEEVSLGELMVKKPYKPTTYTSNNLPKLDADGNLLDSGISASEAIEYLTTAYNLNRRTRRDITNDLTNLQTAIAEQNLAKYGYTIGDYFIGDSGYIYILADMNTFKGSRTPYCLTTNHIGIVVDTGVTHEWHSGDASAVGYAGSTLHAYLTGDVLDNIKADMIALFGGSTGLEHLLSHSKLFTNNFDSCAWSANQYISALTESQISGHTEWSGNSYQEGEAVKPLSVFLKYKWTEIFGAGYPWLRNMVSASNACYAEDTGYLEYTDVTLNRFVAGLINFY